MTARVLIFADDPTQAPILYSCRTCGKVSSPAIYGGGKHAHAQALHSATNCTECNPAPCGCGEKIEKGYSCCRKCISAREADRVAAKIAVATLDTEIDECFSPGGSNFYRSIEEAAEAGETLVFGTSFAPFRVDVGSVIDGILEGHHEDAGADDLVGVSSLCNAMEVFNTEQTSGSFEMDETRYMTINHNRTFAMIKPDATLRGIQGDMLATITAAGFQVVKQTEKVLDVADAEWLYKEHKAREHFADLVAYTVSGPVMLLLLESDEPNTPLAFRKLMGATDRTKAEPGTLRAMYAVGYRENSIHGSDSPAAAVEEICHFFPFFSNGF